MHSSAEPTATRHRLSAVVLTLAVGLATACLEPPSLVIKPFRVINWAPGSGTICVDTLSEVLVTFSEDLAVGSLTGESLQLVGTDELTVPTEVRYEGSSFTAILTPDEALDFDARYRVVADEALEGAEQGPLAVTLESTFRTIGRLGCTPVVDCQLPSDCLEDQFCSSVGTCIPECITSRDCPNGTTCTDGSCS